MTHNSEAKPIVSVGSAPQEEPPERPDGSYPILPAGTDVRTISDALLARGGSYGGAEGDGGLYPCPVHGDGDRPNLNLAVGYKVPYVVTCLVCIDQFEDSTEFRNAVLDALGLDYLPGVRPGEDDDLDWGPKAEFAGGSGGSTRLDWSDFPESQKRYGVAFYPFPYLDEENGPERYGLVVRDELFDAEGKRIDKRLLPWHYVEDASPGRANPATERWAEGLASAPVAVRRYVGKPWRWKLRWPSGPRTPLWWTERESWQGKTLHLTEGEKDAEALRARGLYATTYPFGICPDAATFREHFGDVERVVLYGDLDPAGFGKARKRGKALVEAGYRVFTRFVDRARFEKATKGSADKADVTDWLNAGLPLKAMVRMQAAQLAEPPEPAPVVKPEPVVEREKKPASETEPKGEKKPLAVLLREQVERHYDVFPAVGDGRVYALPKNGGRAELVGGGFVIRAVPKLGREAGTLSNAATEAAKILNSIHEDDAPRRLALRVHHEPNLLVLDLAQPGNTKCVVVSPDGWSVEDVPPPGVVFVKKSGLPLPTPERGGDIEELRALLRYEPDDPHWLLIKGWLPASMLANSPRPLLGFFGTQGAAKTTRGRFVAGVFDPKPPGSLGGSFGKKTDEETKALGSYLPSWDNVSTISDEGSDFLARLVTGDLIERRKLYHDTDQVKINYRRTGVITGVTVPAGLKEDALDRLILIAVQPITGKRVAERVLEAAWERIHPRVLAGVLDLAVKMLAGLRDERGRNPRDLRMMDYAEALYAIDPALYKAFAENVRSARSHMAAEDPFVQRIVEWLSGQPGGVWEGTTEKARKAALPNDLDHPWPKSARAFSGWLTRTHVLLEAAGVRVDSRDSNGATLKRFEMVKKDE